MTTPASRSSNPQDWNVDQWTQALQKGAFRGINVHRLAKVNLKQENAKINFDENKHTISIGQGKNKIEVNLDKLQKKSGFSLRRCFHLSVRSKKTKNAEAKMIGFLANKVHDVIHPEKNSPEKPISQVQAVKEKKSPIIAKSETEEEKVDEKTQAFLDAHGIVNKWISQKTYKNTDTAELWVDGVHQPKRSNPSQSKVSEEEFEEATRLLESEEGKRFLEEEKAKAKKRVADIYKNTGTAKIIEQHDIK